MSLPRFKLRTHGFKIMEYLVKMEEREFMGNPRKNVIKRRLIRRIFIIVSKPPSVESVKRTWKQKMTPIESVCWVFDNLFPVRRWVTFKSCQIKENDFEILTRWGCVSFSKFIAFHRISHLVHFHLSAGFVVVNLVVWNNKRKQAYIFTFAWCILLFLFDSNKQI